MPEVHQRDCYGSQHASVSDYRLASWRHQKWVIAESIKSVERIKTRLNQLLHVGHHWKVLIHHHHETSGDGGRLDNGVAKDEWTVIEIMKSTRCCKPQKLCLRIIQLQPDRLHSRVYVHNALNRDDLQLLDLIQKTVKIQLQVISTKVWHKTVVSDDDVEVGSDIHWQLLWDVVDAEIILSKYQLYIYIYIYCRSDEMTTTLPHIISCNINGLMGLMMSIPTRHSLLYIPQGSKQQLAKVL